MYSWRYYFIMRYIIVFCMFSFSSNSLKAKPFPLPELTGKDIQKMWGITNLKKASELATINSARGWSFSPYLSTKLRPFWDGVQEEVAKILPKDLIYQIILVVASRNRCFYWMCEVVEGLRQKKFDEATLMALQIDLEKIKYPEKEKILLKLAEAMTVQSKDANELSLRAIDLGWKEGQIAKTIYLVGLYNMLTRVANAFAYEPDSMHPYDASKFPMTSCKKN